MLIPQGEIMGIVRPDEVTPEELGLMMAGTHRDRHQPIASNEQAVLSTCPFLTFPLFPVIYR
jgi:hypothetical protein